MKRIVFHHDAEMELWQAVGYYEDKARGLGLDLEQDVSRALAKIQTTPSRWPKKDCGTRCCLLHRFPYAIHYMELRDTLWIGSVAHTRRRPGYWRDRVFRHRNLDSRSQGKAIYAPERNHPHAPAFGRRTRTGN